jgi:hypothetical protein
MFKIQGRTSLNSKQRQAGQERRKELRVKLLAHPVKTGKAGHPADLPVEYSCGNAGRVLPLACCNTERASPQEHSPNSAFYKALDYKNNYSKKHLRF